MKNEFEILTFQSKLSCKRGGVPVVYYSNILEIKRFAKTGTSTDFKIKGQFACPIYPSCICRKSCCVIRELKELNLLPGKDK